MAQIGGSIGHISAQLARHFPALRFIVQDRPELAGPFAASLPADLRTRVAFQPHDFFTPQHAALAPPVGLAGAPTPPSVFLLKHILHDWSDESAARILANLVPALRAAGPRARVLIVESVVPPPGAAPPPAERLVRSMDVVMMSVLAGKERTAAQWAALLGRADPKLVLRHVHVAPFNAVAVVEAELVE
jgi:6-hydroxytryprostatin B O-methyltransferase